MIDRFGEKLRQLREDAGLTQVVLAERLGYKNYGSISLLETGTKKPTAELVLRIARMFGVTTDALLKDELQLKRRDN